MLQWRDEDKKTSKKFAGTVPGVERVRKFHVSNYYVSISL